MIYNRNDLLDSFSLDDVELAEAQRDRAEEPSVQREGEVISSRVESDCGPPHRVYIRVLTTAEGTVSFKGECSCGGHNCHHALIVLVAALARHASKPEVTVATTRRQGLTLETATPPVRMLYVLIPQIEARHREATDSCDVMTMRVHLYTARHLSTGDFGRTSSYGLSSRALRQPPAFLRSEDLEILTPLAAALPAGAAWSVFDLPNASLLSRMLDSECCFLAEPGRQPLHRGERRRATHAWRMDGDGVQHYSLASDPKADVVVLPDALWYLDRTSGSCGPLDMPVAMETVTTLLSESPIPPARAAVVRRTLAASLGEAAALPSVPRLRRLEGCITEPVLQLAPAGENSDLMAQLWFRYGEFQLTGRAESVAVSQEEVVEIERDHSAEARLLGKLESLGWRPEGDGRLRLRGHDRRREHFLLFELPGLRAEGWFVEIDPALGLTLVSVDDSEWRGLLQSDSQGDWFSLDLGVEIDGDHVPLLPAIVQLINSLPGVFSSQGLARLADETMVYVPLDEGRLVNVPLRRLRPILETLLELYESGALDAQGRLRMSRWQAASLSELEQGGRLHWQGDETLLSLAQRLRTIDSVPAVSPPKGLRASLRPYQQRGLDWLQFLRQYGFGGVLADDMGLGKTLQTLAHILLEKEQGRLETPCLVVAPTSLLFNWRREAETFAPDLKTMILHGPKRQARFETIREHDLVITSYGLLLRDASIHARQGYHLLVLDEAQAIKNVSARVSQAARRIQAAGRLCLTGTPMENHLGELWSLFDFLMPGFLGSEQDFKRRFRQPIEKYGDDSRGELLARRIRPYLLRRNKSVVAKELPPVTEILRSVELGEGQRELYESIRLSMHQRVREAIEANGLARSRITVLDALLKLRQVCCDPRLAPLEHIPEGATSAKLALLMDMLPEMIEEGRRVLLFSQFTSMLDLIEDEVQQAGIDYVRLTGQTRDRAAVVNRFQAGEAPLFLISLKAGGVGLNLTAADTVIHYDPWWNPAVEAQATGRAHRIGQQNPVFVYKLVTEGTVEEMIQLMQQRKQALSQMLYQGKGEVEPQWSEEDLENLFRPVG